MNEELKFFVKIQKKNWGMGRVVLGGQVGCERRIEVIVLFKKKILGGGGRGRVLGVVGLGGKSG